MRRGRLKQLCSASLVLALGFGTAPARAQTPLSSHDLALLNRITWGQTASASADMARMGARRWLDAQLHPSEADRRLPNAVQAQIDALPGANIPMVQQAIDMAVQLKAVHQLTDPDQKKAALQVYQQGMTGVERAAESRSLMRDLYAPDQLAEQMTWFWMNHFNVHTYKRDDIRVMIGDYEDQAIRPRALGRFRDLLEATLRHPAMLRYLDNDQNAVGHLNENYAREIMELHTMGVGSGYSQADVEELARILTGVGVNSTSDTPKLKPAEQALYRREGLFEFNPHRHDFGDKTLLGHAIKGSGFGEVEQALDILCRRPATAHHLSLQLATYFMGENPPASVVDRMARTFQSSDGDIAKVLETLFKSREFDDSLTKGVFKDPIHFVVSAVRQAYDPRVIINTVPLHNWLDRMSEGLYLHDTPDGYPMVAAAWNGPGQMAVRFEIARQLGSGSSSLFKPDRQGAVDQPAFPLLQNALYFSGLNQTLSTPTRTVLDQAISPQDWNTLFLSSPEFMKR